MATANPAVGEQPMAAAERIHVCDCGERLAALEAERPHLATKADLAEMEIRILRQASDHFRWLITTMVALAGVMVAAIAAGAYFVVNAINLIAKTAG